MDLRRPEHDLPETHHEKTSGDAETMQILYQAGGNLTELTSNNSWSYELDILTTDNPELAFIRVSKRPGTDFTVPGRSDSFSSTPARRPS